MEANAWNRNRGTSQNISVHRCVHSSLKSRQTLSAQTRLTHPNLGKRQLRSVLFGVKLPRSVLLLVDQRNLDVPRKMVERAQLQRLPIPQALQNALGHAAGPSHSAREILLQRSRKLKNRRLQGHRSRVLFLNLLLQDPCLPLALLKAHPSQETRSPLYRMNLSLISGRCRGRKMLKLASCTSFVFCLEMKPLIGLTLSFARVE